MGTHFATVLGAWLGYAVAYTLLHDVLAPHAGVMAFVPVVVSGWFGGAFAGIVAGLATVPVTVLVAIVMGFGVGSGLSQSTLVGAAAMMLVGYVVGHVRSLNRRIVLQMTAHQQDERALRGSESRFRALVDRNLDGVAVAIDGKIVFVNPTFSKMFGYTEAKLLGVEASVLLVAQDKERARQRIRTQTQSGEVLAAAVFEGIRSDGTHFFLEMLSRQIEFDGKPAFGRSIVDITHPDDPAGTSESATRVFGDAEFVTRLNKRYKRKNGGLVQAETTVDPCMPSPWSRTSRSNVSLRNSCTRSSGLRALGNLLAALPTTSTMP